MTKQITIKLNEERFRPLLDELKDFSGTGLAASDSELVARCIYHCYFSTCMHLPGRTETLFELMGKMTGKDNAEMILVFLKEYYDFKKYGLKKD